MHTPEETEVTRLQRGYLPILRFGLRQPFITLGIGPAGLRRHAGRRHLVEDRFPGLGHRPDHTRHPPEAAAGHEAVDHERGGGAGRDERCRPTRR